MEATAGFPSAVKAATDREQSQRGDGKLSPGFTFHVFNGMFLSAQWNKKKKKVVSSEIPNFKVGFVFFSFLFFSFPLALRGKVGVSGVLTDLIEL